MCFKVIKSKQNSLKATHLSYFYVLSVFFASINAVIHDAFTGI